jgi:nitrite reductase/ring-hydroxylating ferredoxin subunit
MTAKPNEQALVGYRTNEEWNDLLAQVATMIQELEGLEDRELHRKVFATLQAIDAVHREALNRLVRLFKEGVLEQVVTDPAIHTLMAMYDLLPAKHQSGRKIWDFLTPEERGGDSETGEAPLSTVGVEPVESQPHWRPIPIDHRIGDAEALFLEMEEEGVIIARIDGALYAVAAACPAHHALMSEGVLKGYSWICPHGPGCIYDIRNGARLGGGLGLACRPIRETDSGVLQIGFGIPFEPKLPAF